MPSGVLQIAVAGIFRQQGAGVAGLRRQLFPFFRHDAAGGRAAAGRNRRGCAGRHAHLVPGALDGEGVESGRQCAAVGPAEGENLDIGLAVADRFFPAVLLQQAMEIAAAETEGADAGAAWMLAAGDPRACLAVDVEGGAAGGDRFLRLFDLDRRRQDLVIEGHRRLDQAGGAGRSLGVADLRLDRADGAPRRVGFAEDRPQRLDLDGVADLGAGAVRLDQLDASRG